MPLAATDLDRYVHAQDEGGSYDTALEELRRGRKTTHWMWYVLPQLRGLGHSPMADRYGIADEDEARRFAEHPVLGPRLDACCAALLALPPSATAAGVLGPVDALKLRSCATLFERAAPDGSAFSALLDRFFDGERDPVTERILATR